MNYKQATGKSIQQAFEEFHAANPHVYESFIYISLKIISSGEKKLSAKFILNIIRWEHLKRLPKIKQPQCPIPELFANGNENEVIVDTKGTEISFRVNDAFQSYYSRQFVKDYPRYIEYFNFRELRNDKNESTAPITA